MQRLVIKTFPIVTFLALSGCGLFGEPTAKGKVIDSRVLEVGTEKPIAGAIVVALWQGYLAGWAHGGTVCYHVVSTTSDAQGNYHIPAWRKKTKFARAKDKTVRVRAFKPQYRYAKTKPTDRTVYLTKFEGTSRKWMDELGRMLSLTGCPNAGASNKNRLPLINALQEEAKKITPATEAEHFLLVLGEAARLALVDDSKPITVDAQGRYVPVESKAE